MWINKNTEEISTPITPYPKKTPKSFKNPFNKVGKLPAYLYQKTVSPIIGAAAFKTNSILGYKRGSAPAKGSIRYTLLYIVYVLIAFGLFSMLLKVVFN